MRLLLLFLLFFPFSVLTAAPLSPSTPDNGKDEKEGENLDSPRFRMRQFMDLIDRSDLDAAFKFVEMPRGLSLEERRNRIRQLFDVLNRRGDIDLALLSNEPKGKNSDSPYADVEIIGDLRVDSKKIPIELHLVSEKDRQTWKFSQDFIEQIPDVYDDLNRTALENKVPSWLKKHEYFGIKIWQFLGIILIVAFAYLSSLILAWVMSGILKILTRWLKIPIPEQSFNGFVPPLRLFAGLMVFSIALTSLDIDLRFRVRLSYLETSALVFAFTFFAIRLTAAVVEMSRQAYERQGKHSATVMLLPIQRGVNVILAVLGFLFLLKSVGFDVTTIIAGLGIGGVAIALASQKTIENLFGGISVIMDQPVRVGDFGKFGNVMGTVEDIGLRSTKVRTLDRTIVTIPNAEFSHMQIENYERRDKIRWATVLTLRPETTADQMRLLLMKIKELMISHAMVYNEPARVRFIGFGTNGLNIDIFAYVRCSDYSDYLAVLEDLNLRLMDIFQSVGTGIALPSQMTYNTDATSLASFAGERAGFLLDEVNKSGGFPLPHYPPAWTDPIADTLQYPPKP